MARVHVGRRQIDSGTSRCTHLILFLTCVICFCLVYVFLYGGLSHRNTSFVEIKDDELRREDLEKETKDCCRGIEHLELWGEAVRWGSNFKVFFPEECCRTCKDMCKGIDGPCLCDSWVYCGDREACGPRFGECWLKKQKDVLDAQIRDSGDHVMWTSGLIFGKEEGIVGLETEYGILHIRLFPDCAPHSVSYILALLASRFCPGCYFYRAESRGSQWDSVGNHIEETSFGPPFALIQGTLESHGITFEKIAAEDCQPIKRGSVAWVGSGPEFFISLANHEEWKRSYTVFGSVLPADMEIAEKIAQLPTKRDLWSNVSVLVLEKHVPLKIQRRLAEGKTNTNIETDSMNL